MHRRKSFQTTGVPQQVTLLGLVQNQSICQQPSTSVPEDTLKRVGSIECTALCAAKQVDTLVALARIVIC